jgi:hypothetical protein
MVLAPSLDKIGYFDGWKLVGVNGTRIAVMCSLIAAILFVITLARYQRNLRVRYAWLAGVLFLALLQTACGGGGGSSSTAPPETSSTTYTVTVTGTSTGANSVKVTQSTTIMITVQ